MVPNIYFLCRCLSVTESVDGFYCARRRKLPFAAQGKGKKTVVYCISVIHRNSDHYTDCHRAFLQGDPDSLPAQYRNGRPVFWKKSVAYVFGKLGSHLSDGPFPWRGYGIIEKQRSRNDIFLDPGGHMGKRQSSVRSLRRLFCRSSHGISDAENSLETSFFR